MIEENKIRKLGVVPLLQLHKMIGMRRPSHKKAVLAESLLRYQSTGTAQADKLAQAYARLTDPNAQAASSVDADDVRAIVDEVLSERVGDGMKDLAKEMANKIEEIAKSSLDKYRKIEIVTPINGSSKMKGVMPAEFDRLVKLASQRVNVMMVGPAGCGKTFLGKKIAEALKLNFSSISCSAGMSESQLAGWLLPVGKSGTFEYVPSPFVEMYEKGGVFLLDEVDAADPNTLTFINKAIANDSFFLPQRHKKPEVVRHKNFVCLAAANTYGTGADAMYVGRNQLDAATLDRFRAGMVIMDYSPIVEKALIHPKVLEWGLRIREAIQRNKLRKIMSTRVMLDLTKMTEAYNWGPEDWNKSYFADWKADEISRIGFTP